MNNYLLTFDMYISKSNNKLKIDYSFIPVEKIGNDFKSLVSENYTYTDFKKKNNFYVKRFKKKDRVKIAYAFSTELDFEEAERKFIIVAMKKTFWYIPFRFSYKKKLKERVARILA